MITGTNITWEFKNKKGSQTILKNVSFTLRRNRITTFMGKSGAGKTTLLKCIANLHPHYGGTIACDGKDLKTFSPFERAAKVGFVLQQFHLFPHLTVLGNCTYALKKVIGCQAEEAEENALDVLNGLSMLPLAHAYPSQLSGGQQQRAAIARALVLRPDVLLLDEPTSALDPESKKSLEALLLNLHSEGITIALSSHDMPFIRKIMDTVYFMENGTLIEEWDREKADLASTNKIKQFLKERP